MKKILTFLIISLLSFEAAAARIHALVSTSIPGPAILKKQATSSVADMDITGGFDGYLKLN